MMKLFTCYHAFNRLLFRISTSQDGLMQVSNAFPQQGPPGSGKTSAIIGILSMLLVKPFLALQQQDRNSLEAAASSLSRGINKAVALGQLQHGAAAAATAAANSSAGGKKASAAARRSKAAAVVSDVIIPTAPAAADVNGLQKANTGAARSVAVAAPVGSSLDALQLGVVPPVRVRSLHMLSRSVRKLLQKLSYSFLLGWMRNPFLPFWG